MQLIDLVLFFYLVFSIATSPIENPQAISYTFNNTGQDQPIVNSSSQYPNEENCFSKKISISEDCRRNMGEMKIHKNNNSTFNLPEKFRRECPAETKETQEYNNSNSFKTESPKLPHTTYLENKISTGQNPVEYNQFQSDNFVENNKQQNKKNPKRKMCNKTPIYANKFRKAYYNISQMGCNVALMKKLKRKMSDNPFSDTFLSEIEKI